MRYTIETTFKFGDIVYLNTDPDQLPRMVTGFVLAGSIRNILYQVVCGDERETQHYEYELTGQKSFL